MHGFGRRNTAETVWLKVATIEFDSIVRLDSVKPIAVLDVYWGGSPWRSPVLFEDGLPLSGVFPGSSRRLWIPSQSLDLKGRASKDKGRASKDL